MHVHRTIITYIYAWAYMHKYRTCKKYLKIEEKMSAKATKSIFKVALRTERDKCWEYMSHAIY